MRYRDRLRVCESNYGRSEGRDLELDGKPVAFMDEPQFADMFWDSYRLMATSHDPELNERLMSKAFWEGNDWCDLVFRSRATGLTPESPFPAGKAFVTPQRVIMRGLYVVIGDPRPWDRVVLGTRVLMRWWGRRRKSIFSVDEAETTCR